LLRLAGENDQFRALLLEQRAAVASAAGVDLSPSEIAILSAVPARQLETMIHSVPTARPGRREFLRESAASAVVMLGGLALADGLSGCERQQRNEFPLCGGAAPDMPPPRGDAEDDADGDSDTDDDPAADEDSEPRTIHNHIAPGGARPDLDE